MQFNSSNKLTKINQIIINKKKKILRWKIAKHRRKKSHNKKWIQVKQKKLLQKIKECKQLQKVRRMKQLKKSLIKSCKILALKDF